MPSRRKTRDPTAGGTTTITSGRLFVISNTKQILENISNLLFTVSLDTVQTTAMVPVTMPETATAATMATKMMDIMAR